MAIEAIALKIGSSLLLSAAGGAVGNVASLATDQLSLKIVFCFSKAVDELKRSSTQIGNLIHDAALEPEDRELLAMADWMKRLMTVAYAAEDVVDEVQYKFVRIDLEGTILCKWICRICVRLQMACKIDNINKSLDDLYKQAGGVGLTRRSNGGAAASQGMQVWETTSSFDKNKFTRKDAIIVGRDEVVSNITATLTNLNNQQTMLLVMAVVGLPGVGKTTLARLLTKQVKQLKEGEMKEYFDITLWVYVSKTFDVKSILRRMLKLCEATTANPEALEELIPNLRKKLKGRRYFLVLDNVWNEDAQCWEILEEYLQNLESAQGSTVIVTTRSAKVAKIMGTLPNCYLDILRDDECWSIIKDRVFDDPDAPIAPEQEQIGREIARKCAGIPLAAKILGSLMRTKNSSAEWRSIMQSPTWQNSRIMSALMLSFDDLEPPLKPCFAYCSMLDRGSLIKRDELIQLWMAQGFLNPSHPCQRTQKSEMEDIGNEYFKTLLEKSLIQDATKDEDGVITECKMHDLVHEFAIEVSRCENWTPDFNHEMDDREIRHVARIPTRELEIMPKTSIARLRSLFLNVQVSNIIFPKLRALRVLSFCKTATRELPNSLDKLKHLRYLDLSHTAIRELPKSIGKLYNLQTLRLPYLDKCPKEIQNLINLRHLYVDERMEFEAGILERLTNLRTLRYFNVDKEIGLEIRSSLLLSAAGGALGNVASLATDHLSLKIVFSSSKELDQLLKSSTLIGSVIHDAALEPEDRELLAMALWKKGLMTVAYAAEDVADKVQHETVRIDVEGKIFLDKWIRRIFLRLQMAGKIDKINRSLEVLYKQAAGVGLTRRSDGGAAASQGMLVWETTSSFEKNKFTGKEAIIVGRDEVVSDITATLTNPNNQQKMLLVMAIVGLPGGGKTTLARLLTKQLMNEGEMKKHFDIRLWVHVTKTFDVKSILRRILELCEVTTASLKTLEALIQSLGKKLKGKRYFLVLDDVWNEDAQVWEILEECLQNLESAKGSTMIVTTRSAKVAKIMGTLPRCDLGILSDDQCWSIIQDRAFDIPNPLIDSEHERIGRKIAKKCAGLPLVAEILGSLMHHKNSSDEWLSILQSPPWQNSKIMSTMMLSFDDLEPPLKPCFAYCSMLDRGSLIKRDELIQLWMAQGFLNPSPRQRMQNWEMEDMGNEYFDTLLEKSLFQDVTKDKNDVITECKMHDLVREFAIVISRGESWTQDFNHEIDDSEIRHVARISTPNLESMSETSIARLRSLFSNVPVSKIIFPKLRALRVLSFYEAETRELPNSLDKLMHLRYLDLSHTAIRDLPKSIGKLYNLQTLRLPYLDKCPKEIQNLINLRYLYVDERNKFEAGILGRLTNLRRLRYFDMRLRRLGYFNMGKEIGLMIRSSLLLSATGRAVGNVVSLETDQLSLKIAFSSSKELDQLRQSLTQIGNLIHDAALEPEDQELQARADWMKRLMPVAYAAEDVVDEVQYEDVRINIEGTILDKCIRRIFVRLQMASKIDNIKKSLQNLHNEAPGVGLTRRSNERAASSQGMQDRETSSLLEKHTFTSKYAKKFGREKAVSDITATLYNPNNQQMMLLVMVIVGLAGGGKTTLARLLTKQLMKEGEMKKHFDITLWVYVSKTFDVRSILRGMLESCEATTANLETRQALIQILRQKLKEKRYFLVLDDVWNEDHKIWEDLKCCLLQLESAKGSTVIVTTRSAKVAKIMGTLPNCDLDILWDDECWSIIKDRVFDDPDAPIEPEQERIGRKIAKKCAGLPLVAEVLGSLMRSKNSSDEWLSILQSPPWHNSKIMSTLMLSFDYLEPPLKPCFAYCSMLNKGSLIKRDELIQLWMAQGFLNPMQNREMEDIGNEYFDTLLEKSLIQDATKDEDGVITECKMHDLVHEFAIEVSRCEKWTPDFNHEMDDREIRHVARIPTRELESMPQTSIARLRSLFSNVPVSKIIFPKLRDLRVLSFYEAETQELPNSLDKLKHLRYLDLSHTAIRELPKSTGKLYNLQTLRLPYLDKCPKEIRNLINLRHLYVDERMKFEAGILGRLTNLRTLRYFNVGKETGPAIEELGGLKQLTGHLIIDGLENVRDREEAKNACLVQKSHLHELTFKWTYGGVPNENQTDVLDGLEPHCELQRLNIENFMGAGFPSWIWSLQELKEIRLVGCNNCAGLPTGFHSLASLKKLTIGPFWKELDAFPDFQLPTNSPLKELELEGWPKLKSLPQQIQHFTCLKELRIHDFMGLEALPEWLGNLTSLEALRIWDCENLEYLPMKNLTKLKELSFYGCPMLEKRYTKETDPEWPKISHIPIFQCGRGYENAESSTSYPRNAENLASSPINAVLGCLPCCIL